MTARPNRVLAIIVGTVVALAVAAAVVAANRPEVQLDPASPEGTVQAYARAVVDGDVAAAVAFFESGSACDVDDDDAAYLPEAVRLVLVDSTVTGDGATVTVEIVDGDGSGVSEYSREEKFSLVNENGAWRLTGEPWPLYYCGDG